MPPSASRGTVANTYLYVGAVSPSTPSNPLAVGSVAQFRVESDGTLSALNPPTIAGVVPSFGAAVTPSNQYLFVPAAEIGGAATEFGIGSDGTLTPNGAQAFTGSSVGFTPNGQLAIIPNPSDDTLTSYRLGLAGALTPINTVGTGSFPQTAIVDGSGKFAYVTNLGDGTISEYTISAGGILAPNGSTPTGGYNPRALVFSPRGFLYCGNGNSGSVSEYSIDASTGALTLVSTYVIWAQPQPGPWWISFDPSGAYAYVGNQNEIAQFTVNSVTGTLVGNGTTPTPLGNLWGGVDPSGKFVFSAGTYDGTISGFIITSNGTLVPNGSVSLGANMVAETLAFAQR